MLGTSHTDGAENTGSLEGFDIYEGIGEGNWQATNGAPPEVPFNSPGSASPPSDVLDLAPAVPPGEHNLHAVAPEAVFTRAGTPRAQDPIQRANQRNGSSDASKFLIRRGDS